MSALEQIAAKKIAMNHDGWKRFGYKKTVLDALARWLDKDEPDYDLATSIFAVADKYLPDLYKIDEDKKIIGLMEIEDYSKLRTDKLKAYSELWHDADFYGITIEIYTADRYGRNIEYLDLFPAFCHSTELKEQYK